MLKSEAIEPIPEETVEVAQAAFPKGTDYLQMRDELGCVFADEQFADLFPRRGQPAEAPWRLALITVMQFAEDLTDRQAADAVRARIDWKYALGLELRDPGFDFGILSEFRERLIDNEATERLLDTLLTCFSAKGLLKTGRQRTDSTHMLGNIRLLNQLELIGETLRYVLNTLAVAHPSWLKNVISPEWFDRYSRPINDYRLPKAEDDRRRLAEQIGADGQFLLACVESDSAPAWLQQLSVLDTLRRVWAQQFVMNEQGQLQWQTGDQSVSAGQHLCSPYDPDARYARKRETRWVGYKVHLTETCVEDAPNLITHVETVEASQADGAALGGIHADLAQQCRLPSEHVVDAGYISSQTLAKSQNQYPLELLGPVRPDNSWQAQAPDRFDITHFAFDWERQVVTCPAGKTSLPWREYAGRRDQPTYLAKFRESDCRRCPLHASCIERPQTLSRSVSVLKQQEFLALQAARKRQLTDSFKESYAIQAGIEGTISQAAFTLGMRRARYRGLPKVHLQNIAIAAAMNLIRVLDWLGGEPRSCVRKSPFAALAA